MLTTLDSAQRHALFSNRCTAFSGMKEPDEARVLRLQLRLQPLEESATRHRRRTAVNDRELQISQLSHCVGLQFLLGQTRDQRSGMKC
ncbi:hypothetical protein D3C87_1542020 [compost metagenome]